MRRRQFITLLGGAAAWPLAARAQQVSSVPRIGYLSPGSASSGPLNYYDEFRRELRELGYVEGQNVVIDYRFADGKFDRLPQLAAELVQLNVDVIVSVVTQASRPRLRPGNWVFNSRPLGCEVPTSSVPGLQRSSARTPPRC